MAVGEYFIPHQWNVNTLFLLVLCPMYLIRLTLDPPLLWVFVILAPMNAALWGAFGTVLGYVRLAFRSGR